MRSALKNNLDQVTPDCAIKRQEEEDRCQRKQNEVNP